MKNTAWISFLLTAAVLFAPACTNKQAETESPVFITTSLTLQTGFVNVAQIAPVQVPSIVLTSTLKNPSQSDPQGFATTTLESYTVHFRRTDGGSRVPADLNLPVGITIPSGGSATLSNFPVLPASQVQLSPFDQLLPFNGGFDRETGKAEIDMAVDITFFGHTVSGHRVQSETATGPLLFRFSATAVSGNSNR